MPWHLRLRLVTPPPATPAPAEAAAPRCRPAIQAVGSAGKPVCRHPPLPSAPTPARSPWMPRPWNQPLVAPACCAPGTAGGYRGDSSPRRPALSSLSGGASGVPASSLRQRQNPLSCPPAPVVAGTQGWLRPPESGCATGSSIATGVPPHARTKMAGRHGSDTGVEAPPSTCWKTLAP